MYYNLRYICEHYYTITIKNILRNHEKLSKYPLYQRYIIIVRTRWMMINQKKKESRHLLLKNFFSNVGMYITV